MDRTKVIRSGILMLLAFFASFTVSSQDLTPGEPGQELREIAKEATARWNMELSLTTKQARLIEKKILEFEMKKEEIMNSKMNEEAKKARLTALQTRESSEFRNILTKPQFEKYLEVQSRKLRPSEKENKKG
ncbi:hypothetical protein FHG64_08790 [Antarcticibacterium flavum]|uniref:DUF4890 domain-containing protein n=1 Tax=Antarcticibacterium flavum TaxID=2058175 RepID=A0A5B7X448_9FLAO|nr:MULTISPECIES: hypothetical protein [Antarcticibacterium]MCM4159074.1 hypothetical protein [Antarcticibacterium sp. W02-3]QCY69478.1 hypothetical protein FHG64_08790 [Antarcticibacterium flavum]